MSYKLWLAASVVSNVLMSIFAIVSIPLFMPFFKLLFNPDKISNVKPVLVNDPSYEDYLNFELSKLIDGRPLDEALLYVIIAFFLTFFFKNIFRYLGMFFITPPRNGFIKDSK